MFSFSVRSRHLAHKRFTGACVGKMWRGSQSMVQDQTLWRGQGIEESPGEKSLSLWFRSKSFSKAAVEFLRHSCPLEKIFLLGRSGPCEGRLGQQASGNLYLDLET